MWFTMIVFSPGKGRMAKNVVPISVPNDKVGLSLDFNVLRHTELSIVSGCKL